MNLKSNKAITLVALIITIIVLLILAGVSLSMVLGDNGLINKAQSSVDKYQQSANNEQDFFNSIEEYIDLKAENIVTAKEIESNPKKYYGAKVTNYTAGGATWRIFYVDTADGTDGNGKYGDEKNTVYLIAEYDDKRGKALGTKNADNTYTANAYASSTTKIREMNPTWATNRGSLESSWNKNEKAAAYLCDTSKWTAYYDSTKANYAIGSPSLEMYADSYNKTHNSNSLVYRYQTNRAPGYGVGVNGIYSNNDGWYTNNNAIDTSQNGIYMCRGEHFWLASPSCGYISGVSLVYVKSASVNRSDILGNAYVVCPIVSLKSDFQIKIEV